MKTNTAILVTAHGSIESLDEIPAFLQRIRRGRPAPPELIAEVHRRYAAIGGSSPLLALTLAQASGVAERLNLSAFVGMRLSSPSIESAISHAIADGATRIVSLPLAPYSLSVYHAAVARAITAMQAPVTLVEVGEYHCHPSIIEYFAEQVQQWVERTVISHSADKMQVIFTAHSLPTAVIAAGDRYATMVSDASAAVEREWIAQGLSVHSTVAYQSQGASEGPWLGPSLREQLRAAKESGRTQVLLVPLGFYADHVEVLYDLDIEAQHWAKELHLEMTRTQSPNTHPLLIDALAQIVGGALDKAG